jgi:hypothetical protein
LKQIQFKKLKNMVSTQQYIYGYLLITYLKKSCKVTWHKIFCLVPLQSHIKVLSYVTIPTLQTNWGQNWGQTFSLDINFFSTPAIFLPSFLSFLIFSLTRLHAWDTPDSPIPKYLPISFNFSPVYL